MGSTPACASSATVEVARIAPVMKMVDVRCTRTSFVAKAMDPRFFFMLLEVEGLVEEDAEELVGCGWVDDVVY